MNAYRNFFGGADGLTTFSSGPHQGRTYVEIFDRAVDYARWVVEESARYPTHAALGHAARWFERAFELKRVATQAQMDVSWQAAMDAADQKRRLMAAAEQEALHIRRQKSNAEMLRLPPDLLLHILSFAAFRKALHLPCVCKDLHQKLGPLTAASPRMQLIIDDLLSWLSGQVPRITGGWEVTKTPGPDTAFIGNGGFGRDEPFAWRYIKILASKVLIDLQYTTLGVLRGSADDFKALAVRSVAHKDTFLRLRESARVEHVMLKQERIDCVENLKLFSYTGKFSARKKKPQSPQVIVPDLEVMQGRILRLNGLMKEMESLNTMHSLCLHIPKMRYTTNWVENEALDAELERFLDPRVRPS
jgi:hypothetical protein